MRSAHITSSARITSRTKLYSNQNVLKFFIVLVYFILIYIYIYIYIDIDMYIYRFDVSSKGPSSGISVGGRVKHTCFYTSEYIKTTCDKIKSNQMDLIKTRNK